LTAGISLLFDTYTFLRTNWSPLRVPLFAADELAVGYLLAVGGIFLVLAPTLLDMVSSYAPDASMKMGQDLAHQSVELGLQGRLPLRKRLSAFPNRGLVGGVVMLLLLVPMFLMVTEQDAKGIYIRLVPQRGPGPDENCLAGPIVVTIKQHKGVSRTFLNRTEIRREDLDQALRGRLAKRAKQEVFVEGDADLQVADPMYAIEVINALPAKAVILTPGLKRQMDETCRPR
jgi:biopolymer transport protein ExbD